MAKDGWVDVSPDVAKTWNDGWSDAPSDTAFVTADGKTKTNNPEYRKGLANFIRSQGARNVKQELVRGLPMGNTVADKTMGTYNDPVHPERAVDSILGAAPYSDASSLTPNFGKTPLEATIRGAEKFISNPAPQIEGLLSSPFATAYNLSDAQTKGRLGDASIGFGKQLVAPINVFDPEGMNKAWEENFLGSAAILEGARGLGKKGMEKSADGLSNILTDWVGNKPVERVVRSLKASTGLTLAEKQTIANTLLEHGVVGDIAKREGTTSLESKIAERETKIGEVVDAYKGQDATVPALPIIKALKQMKTSAMKSGDWKTRLADIDEAIKDLESNPLNVNGQIPIDAAQAMKIDFGKRSSWGEYTDFKNAIRKTQNVALGNEIANVAPEIKPINAELGPMYEALGPVSRAESRIGNLETGMSLKQTNHGVLGPIGKVYGAIKGVTESNRISPLIAQGMYNLKAELNPTVKPQLTVPDFIPLPPKPPLTFDPSTGKMTFDSSQGRTRGLLDIPVGEQTFFDPMIGARINRKQ